MSNLTDLQRIKQSVEIFNGLRSAVIDVDIVFDFFRSNQDLFRRTRLFKLQCDCIFYSGDERQACEYFIRDDAAFNTFIEQLQMTCRFFEDVNIINELSNVDRALDLDRRIEDYSNGDVAQDDVIVVQAERLDQGEEAKRFAKIASITALSMLCIPCMGIPLLGSYMGLGESDYLVLCVYSFPGVFIMAMICYEYLPLAMRNDSNLDPSQHPAVLQALPVRNDSNLDPSQHPAVLQAFPVRNDSNLDPSQHPAVLQVPHAGNDSDVEQYPEVIEAVSVVVD